MEELENYKKIKGYEITIFIEEEKYNKLKEKAKKRNTTVDLLIDKLIDGECRERSHDRLRKNVETIYSIDEIRNMARKTFRHYGIKKAYLSGSYAKSEATKNSNICIIIEKGEFINPLKLMEFEIELAGIFKKDIDLFTEENLRYEENKQERIVIYE